MSLPGGLYEAQRGSDTNPARRQHSSSRHLVQKTYSRHDYTPHHMVEHPRVIADRIVRFARIVGRENVIAASDCGFAQQATIARVHPKVMWAKFEALAAGARLATAELWGRAAA